MNRPRRGLLVLLLAMTLLAAGCGSRQETSDKGATVDAVSLPAVSARADPRQIVYTADLTVRVGAVGRATTDAVGIASDAGGLVFAQSSDLQGRKEARLTLKVPPERSKLSWRSGRARSNRSRAGCGCSPTRSSSRRSTSG